MCENPPNSGIYEISLDPGSCELIITTTNWPLLKKAFKKKSGTNKIDIDLAKLDEKEGI